jgi:hypothetical protein
MLDGGAAPKPLNPYNSSENRVIVSVLRTFKTYLRSLGYRRFAAMPLVGSVWQIAGHHFCSLN